MTRRSILQFLRSVILPIYAGEFGESRTSFQVGMADKSSSSVDVYLLGEPVPVPERRQMLLPDSGRQNFEAGARIRV